MVKKVPSLDDVTFGTDDYRMPERRRLEVGKVVEGQVVAIGDTDIFVDIGTKSEGVIEKAELADKDGKVSLEVGDAVRAYIVALEPNLVLSYSLGRSHLNLQMLQDAFDMQLPVEGKVVGVNKGGFEIDLAGTRAFCPISQIELGFCEDGQAYIGQTLTFQLKRFEEEGRNIVVSRRELLQQEQAEAAELTRAQLQEGAEFTGEVMTLQPYGAFVDIGGLQGLLHVSEISHQRIDDPAALLQVGQRVRVRVQKIDRDPKHPDRERIGLSMRALLDDPWEEQSQTLKEGDVIDGKVVRLKPFGAFVEIAPGVDGLVHISELADRRIADPAEVVTVGETVKATVLKIDVPARRISLSLRGGAEASGVTIAVGEVVEVIVDRIKPFGLLVNIKGGGRGARGLIPSEETGRGPQVNLRRAFPEGSELRAMITEIEPGTNKLRLSLTAVGEQEERASFNQYAGSQQKKSEPGAESSLGTFADKLRLALDKK